MAARKRSSSKSGRSSGATKRSKPRSAARATRTETATTRAVTRVMTEAERRRLLTPPERYDEIAAELVDAWAAEDALRVPSLTRTRLRALSVAAERARARELAFREQMESRLAALSEARLSAENDLWRAVLAVNQAVKAHARRDSAILDRFAFLDDLVVRRVPTYVPPERRVRI